MKTNVRINFGASFTDGNTKTENIYGDGELVARTVKNRFTLGGSYLRSESEDVTTADRILGYMKYDYFLTKKWYLYAALAGEKGREITGGESENGDTHGFQVLECSRNIQDRFHSGTDDRYRSPCEFLKVG